MHNARPNGAPWYSSSLYTNGSSHSNPQLDSGSVGTACSSPDGGGDYPMAESQHQPFYSSLHDALASDAAPANNLNTSTDTAAYSSLGLHTYPPLTNGLPVHRQSEAPFYFLNSIYSPPSRLARKWVDNLVVKDDPEPFPDCIDSSDTGDYYRRAAVSVKHEPEDADMGRMDAQQRARTHFDGMEHHHTSEYKHHAQTLSLDSGFTASHSHPPHSPHAGFAFPSWSPLSPCARTAHPAPPGAGAGTVTGAAAASTSGAATDIFHADSKALHAASPFSAFSSAGGVAGVSSPMPDMLFDVGANGGSDRQASLLASPPAEPILPHAMTAPLRAVNAPKEMRRMMGVFRLNPFTMMNGAPVKSAWDGSGAGPLESEPVQLEFRVYFEGMLIEDEEDEGGGGSGDNARGRRFSEDDGYVENEDLYEAAGPGAPQAHLGSLQAFGHAQRTPVRNLSPPAFNAFGMRAAGPSSMGASTTIARSIFDRDLERQREMRGGGGGGGGSVNANGGPFASSASFSMTHHHSAINTNAMHANGALLRSHSTASGSVSDGLSDSSTAVCAVPESTLGVSGVDSADFLASVDLDSSRPHSQGSFGSPHPSAYPPTSSAYTTGTSTQAALRAPSHPQSLFRGAGSSAAQGGTSASMFTTTPAVLAAEMHMSVRARQLYGAGRTRHGSLSSNRTEMSGSASPPEPVLHGAADYQQHAVHRSPNLLRHHQQQQQQQQRPSRHAAPLSYQQVSSAVALDLNELAAPTPSVGQQSFIGLGHGGEPYARDQSNATMYGLSSASFGGYSDGSNQGHTSPVELRRWPDTFSMQRVYS